MKGLIMRFYGIIKVLQTNIHLVSVDMTWVTPLQLMATPSSAYCYIEWIYTTVNDYLLDAIVAKYLLTEFRVVWSVFS